MADNSNLPKIVLDPRNEDEVLEEMYRRTLAASNGVLSDFGPGSPIAALFEGHVYATAELLYYLNKLPEATAIEVFRNYGVSRSPGTYARGTLKVLLKQPLLSNFTLPVGYLIPWTPSGSTATGAGWVLEEALFIAAGSLEGSVNVRASAYGTAYNVPAYSVRIDSSPLVYVQSIYNPAQMTGGSSVEDMAAYLLRAQRAVRTRDVLVSTVDYEKKAEELLGTGSKAACIPLLSSNKTTEVLGEVHVFLVGDGLVLPSTATCQDIKRTLQSLSFGGCNVWVDPADLQAVIVDVVIEVESIDRTIAEAIQTALESYLSPTTYPIGSSLRLKEVEYFIRSTTGVNRVVTSTINRDAVDLPMANKYTFPYLDALVVSMVDPNGFSQTFYLGRTTGDQD